MILKLLIVANIILFLLQLGGLLFIGKLAHEMSETRKKLNPHNENKT